eukprot:m.25345 g.25345  ORF g.25345 m.25345 type:complete len:300 (+) comp14963_c0_seq2:117-1016(+)
MAGSAGIKSRKKVGSNGKHSTTETQTNADKSEPNIGKVVCSGVAIVLIGYVVSTLIGGNVNVPGQTRTAKFSALTVDENEFKLPDPLEVLRESYNVTVLHEDPMILQFENFLSAAECKQIIKLAKNKMERSTAGLGRETDQSRTSSTGWLMDPREMNDETVVNIQNRIAQVTNTHANNQEHFQVLHYKVGQFYREHHDYIPEQDNFPAGARLATFFMYLSDVEEGGGTDFRQLGVRAMPKRGRAVLWYNVQYNNQTKKFEQDERTHHEAMPPIKGIKWATNKWIHVNDFQTPFKTGNSA